MKNKVLLILIVVLGLATSASAYVCCPEDTVALCDGTCCNKQCGSDGKCPTCPEKEYPITDVKDGKVGCCPNPDDGYISSTGCCPKNRFSSKNNDCCIEGTVVKKDDSGEEEYCCPEDNEVIKGYGCCYKYDVVTFKGNKRCGCPEGYRQEGKECKKITCPETVKKCGASDTYDNNNCLIKTNLDCSNWVHSINNDPIVIYQCISSGKEDVSDRCVECRNNNDCSPLGDYYKNAYVCVSNSCVEVCSWENNYAGYSSRLACECEKKLNGKWCGDNCATNGYVCCSKGPNKGRAVVNLNYCCEDLPSDMGQDELCYECMNGTWVRTNKYPWCH